MAVYSSKPHSCLSTAENNVKLKLEKMWVFLSHLVDIVAYFDDLVVKLVAHLHGQSVYFFEESRWLDVGNI